jgi:hypothetical protein
MATYQVPMYATYGAVSLVLTVLLARTLFKNGAVFLNDVFKGNTALADAVNRLLVVGFYLVNLGYACLILQADAAETAVGAVETLARKLGLLLVSLAVMHFLNLYIFHRMRARALEGGGTFLGQKV